MKKSPYLFLFCTLFVVSCNNDLDLIAPTKDIPIVYGILSKLNTDHYIRIEKAFVDENIPVAELAADSDNFLYEDLKVKITQGGIDKELQRVDGAVEGFSRETGYFDNEPNILYKLEDVRFAGGQTITLTIDRGPDFEPVTASTQIVNNIELKVPNLIQGGQIDINPNPNIPLTFIFEPGSNAKIFDIFITFHYREIDITGQVSKKELVWSFVRNYDLDGDGLQEVSNEGVRFYRGLLAKIPVEPGTVRRFSKLSLDIVGGGQEVRDYVRLTQANTGFTSFQEVPNFSNLSEGIGIFSSKFTYHIDSLRLGQISRIELEDGELLKDLNFE